MRQLTSLLVLLALLALLGAAGAGATPEKRYLKVSAQAQFRYALDYGSDPRAVYNGTFVKSIFYRVRAIVIFDGSYLSPLPGASMVIQGDVAVKDDRTEWVSAQSRKPVECKSPARLAPGLYGTHTGPGGPDGSFVFTKSGAHVTVSRTGLRVDTGTALRDIGCHATEGPLSHGLPEGPSFTVSAPARSRFSGSEPFSITCRDDYSHPPTTNEPNGNHHSFTGTVAVSVTLTPFPATKLTNVKQALRDSVGDQQPYASIGNQKDCLH